MAVESQICRHYDIENLDVSKFDAFFITWIPLRPTSTLSLTLDSRFSGEYVLGTISITTPSVFSFGDRIMMVIEGHMAKVILPQ